MFIGVELNVEKRKPNSRILDQHPSLQILPQIDPGGGMWSVLASHEARRCFQHDEQASIRCLCLRPLGGERDSTKRVFLV